MINYSKNPFNIFILILRKIIFQKLDRIMIFISGIPGSGKTTLTEVIKKRLFQILGTNLCSSIQMDAFHYPLKTLHLTLDHKESIRRRGSYWTFNADVIRFLVKQLKKTRNT